MIRHTLIAACACLSLCSTLALAKGHRRGGKCSRGNYTVFKYPIMAEKRLHLKRVKVKLDVRATVKPSEIKSTLATLKSMQIDGAKPLEVNQFNQNKTSTGLINVRATLTGVLPISNLQAAYRLVSQHSRSGLVIRIANVQPFFPLRMQQRVKQTLSIKMYKMAQQFADQLSTASSKPFTIAKINFNMNANNRAKINARMQQYTMLNKSVSDVQASLPLLKVIQLKANVMLRSKTKRPRPQQNQPAMNPHYTNDTQHNAHPHHARPPRRRPRRQPQHGYPGQMH